jgi:hypothetical protein
MSVTGDGEMKATMLLPLLVLIVSPNTAHAVLPPDFLLSAGAQMAHVFSLIFLFFLSVFAGTYRSLRTIFQTRWWWKILLSIVGIGVVSYLLARAYILVWG